MRLLVEKRVFPFQPGKESLNFWLINHIQGGPNEGRAKNNLVWPHEIVSTHYDESNGLVMPSTLVRVLVLEDSYTIPVISSGVWLYSSVVKTECAKPGRTEVFVTD